MNRRLLTAVLLLVAAAPLAAQQVTLTADSSSVELGGPFGVSVVVTHPADHSVRVPAFKDTLGSFDIIAQDSLLRTDEGGVVTLTKRLLIAQYAEGRHVIPSVAVPFTDPSGRTGSAASAPVPVEVRSVEIDTTSSIRDLKPQLTVPMSAEEIALYAALLLLLAGAAYGGYRLWKRRRSGSAPASEPVPVIPPDVLAMIKLDELEAKGLWRQGEYKAFYSEATEIVRRYFEQRYGIMALEMTSGEVMRQLERCALPRETTLAVERFLTGADLVKFAKHHPSAAENESVVPEARSIVEATRPAAASVPPDQGGAAHG